MNQTNHFYDVGFGWLCKHCSASDSEAYHSKKRSRFFGRGESSQKQDRPLGPPLASWTDPSRQSLFCPRCGIHETIKA